MLINAVSLPAKKAARMSSAASAANISPGLYLDRLLTPMPPEQILEHELHAEIGHRQDAKAPQGPAHRRSPAPAEAQTPNQQHAEQQPGNDRQDGFLHQVLR